MKTTDMEDIKKKPEYITQEEAIALINALLTNYSGIFRVQSGLLSTIKLRLVNLGADPSGPSEVGDIVCVGGKIKVCTTAGNPGTFQIVGVQS